MEITSLTELFAGEKERFIQNCTLCGVCVESCPAIPYTPLSTIEASDIMARAMDVLQDGSISEEATIRAASCMQCAACRDVCPQEINPQLIQEILQLDLVKLGQKRYPKMEIKMGDGICFLPDVVVSMQIKPEEKRWLDRVPDNPTPRDIVVFAGCSMLMMPDKIFTLSDILEGLGLDFVMVAGGELCCGSRYSGVNLQKAEAHGRALVNKLSAFKPQQVIFCCTECAHQVTQYYKKMVPISYEFDEIFHFLSQRLDQLEFTHQVNKTVTLHDPCALTRLFGDTTSLRQLLKAIPGVTLVEMHKNKEQAPCCGSAASRNFPQVGQEMTRQCLQEAARTGAEVLVDACQGCHLQFCPEEAKYPFEIQNCLTIIGKAMGIAYEDKLKKFYRYGQADTVLAETKDNIEAGPYELKFVANLAKRLFERPMA
ncbi:MAG: (Fe-S)-binding protein [Candidatus Tectomicrobia bacterium]|uniref:(Fe-S)-binding protein n=1 Tax=Tectimicrobiota bacterium TaxID=2528274 RepID=A0A933GQI1_UNCTE|nr:(Fe-S)-binding protein [Candidatus Tectomicrobia bacterium]